MFKMGFVWAAMVVAAPVQANATLCSNIDSAHFTRIAWKQAALDRKLVQYEKHPELFLKLSDIKKEIPNSDVFIANTKLDGNNIYIAKRQILQGNVRRGYSFYTKLFLFCLHEKQYRECSSIDFSESSLLESSIQFPSSIVLLKQRGKLIIDVNGNKNSIGLKRSDFYTISKESFEFECSTNN